VRLRDEKRGPAPETLIPKCCHYAYQRGSVGSRLGMLALEAEREPMMKRRRLV
jgi:hypothetical protein